APRPLGLSAPATAAAAATAPTAATAAPACCATMASLRVLSFHHEGRVVQFDTWLDDLKLYLLSDSKDSVSLFELTPGAATAPPATADSANRSKWLTRNAAAHLAIRNHLPLAECAHFGQHRTAQALDGGLQGATLLVSASTTPLTQSEAVTTTTATGGGPGGTGGGSGGSGGGSGGSGGSGGGGTGGDRTGPRHGGPGGGQRQQQQCRSETQSPQQLREWLFQRGTSGGSDSCPYVIRTGVRAGQTCGKLHTQNRCFSRLDDPWRAEFVLRVTVSALHTFTLDSGASRCFFRDSTTLTPLPTPVPVRLADPSEGPVIARSSTVLLCLAVSASGQVAASCSCRLLSHQTLQWHHRLGHPSLPRLRGMHSCLLVSSLPRSVPPLPPSPALPCLPCVEGWPRAASHSSSFPPTTAPLQTLHMDV
ncbi:unnamed protein product, partial [Closterium sp. NIES-54]